MTPVSKLGFYPPIDQPRAFAWRSRSERTRAGLLIRVTAASRGVVVGYACASAEIDGAEFLPMAEARRRIRDYQASLLDRLEVQIASGDAG